MTWSNKHFVESNATTMKCCPQPGCDYVAFKSMYLDSKNMKCPCGESFCFSCGAKEDHQPMSCLQLKQWKEKESSDAENIKYIKAYTKSCPRCFTQIEKDQGCAYMMCTTCKKEFCWICLEKTENHKHSNGENGDPNQCNKVTLSKL